MSVLQLSIMFLLVLIVVADILFFGLLMCIYGFDLRVRRKGSVYVPSKRELVTQMVHMAGSLKGKTVVDVGSGDGRVLRAFVRGGAKQGIGYEMNPALVIYSRILCLVAGMNDRIFIKQANYWKHSLSHADIVTIFGDLHILGRLEKKLRKELPQGSIVISNELPFPHWNVHKQKGKIFLYQQK